MFEGLMWAIACLAGVYTLVVLIAACWQRELPAGNAAGRPSVSVVVTARDEEHRVEQTLVRLLAQDGVELEVVAVDDRSTDRTPSILARLASRHPQLRVIRVDELPAGWLGKNHACHVGAAAASGDWLLFTDADAWPEPDLLARAVATARAQQADHLCLIPAQRWSTAWGRAGWIGFYLLACPAFALVNRDLFRGPIGVGAFNLVRAEAYSAVGGHGPLRFEVVDDAKLGLLLLRAGFRTRVYDAIRSLEVDWAGSLTGIVRAFEKNLFAALGYRPVLALLAVLVPLAAWALALAAPLSGTAAGWASFAGLWALTVPSAVAAARIGGGLGSALLAPLALPTLPLALLYSTWRTLARRGVRWRRTFYPLDQLRRGQVR